MMNCWHWLICLALFFNHNNESTQGNILSSAWKDLESTEQVKQAVIEYDRGLNERCSQPKKQQLANQKCYKQARQRLRTWLDNQLEECLTLPATEADAMVINQCRAGADAAFRLIVLHREKTR